MLITDLEEKFLLNIHHFTYAVRPGLLYQLGKVEVHARYAHRVYSGNIRYKSLHGDSSPRKNTKIVALVQQIKNQLFVVTVQTQCLLVLIAATSSVTRFASLDMQHLQFWFVRHFRLLRHLSLSGCFCFL